jgi:ferredoxin-NADP reductase
MWNIDTKLARVIRRSPTVKSFQFPAEGADFQAGQFFFVTIKVNGQDAVHHFSFSSSPTDKGYIEFTKRITGSDYSRVLNALKPGDAARLRGPFGIFTMPGTEGTLPPLAFLSGGIGVTPLRSMLRYILHEGLPFDVVMLYGCPSREEILFRDEFDEMKAAHRNIRVEYVLSGPDFPADWQGKRGFINKDLVAGLIPDYKDRIFYISGPPKMVASLSEQVAALSVPPERLKRDSFTGYD